MKADEERIRRRIAKAQRRIKVGRLDSAGQETEVDRIHRLAPKLGLNPTVLIQEIGQ